MNADTQNERNDDVASESCAAWRPLLTLLAAGDELDPAGQTGLAAHLADCAACSAALERERELLALLAAHREEPGADLLANCRASLADALDREEERGWLRRSFGLLLPESWLVPRPAWSAAILVMIGFSVGFFGLRLLRRPLTPGASENAAARSAANAAAAPSATNSAAPANPGAPAASAPAALDVRSADVAAINVFPSGGGERPRVELHLKARQPVTVEGTVDDDDVKGVLLDILRHGGRYSADVRLDAVDLLRACNSDPEVRAVLCHAVHVDRDATVRLKALEALGGAGPQDIVLQTLLDALAGDQDPGVRLEAINAVRDMTARGQVVSDSHMLAVLRERMQKDPTSAVRLQSAAAIRDLSSPTGP
jgi:hypothetical protein